MELLLDAESQIETWQEVILVYNAALKQINTKLEILNDEFQHVHQYNPIEHIKSRLKTADSIVKKLKKDGCEVTIDNMMNHLSDIAGIRIICSFTSDIYQIAEMIAAQGDVTVIHVKDYIKNPKPNGYRSLHVIIAVPVYYLDTMEYFPVEIQLRTMTMDLWASMEHRVCYKKLPEHRDELAEAFCQYADILGKIEEQFEAYNETGMLEEITPAQIAENPSEG